jgi:hypothetical protein
MEFVKKPTDIKIQVKSSEKDSPTRSRERRMASLITLNNNLTPNKNTLQAEHDYSTINIERLISRNILDKDSQADKHLKIFKLT